MVLLVPTSKESCFKQVQLFLVKYVPDCPLSMDHLMISNHLQTLEMDSPMYSSPSVYILFALLARIKCALICLCVLALFGIAPSFSTCIIVAHPSTLMQVKTGFNWPVFDAPPWGAYSYLRGRAVYAEVSWRLAASICVPLSFNPDRNYFIILYPSEDDTEQHCHWPAIDREHRSHWDFLVLCFHSIS